MGITRRPATTRTTTDTSSTPTFPRNTSTNTVTSAAIRITTFPATNRPKTRASAPRSSGLTLVMATANIFTSSTTERKRLHRTTQHQHQFTRKHPPNTEEYSAFGAKLINDRLNIICLLID